MRKSKAGRNERFESGWGKALEVDNG